MKHLNFSKLKFPLYALAFLVLISACEQSPEKLNAQEADYAPSVVYEDASDAEDIQGIIDQREYNPKEGYKFMDKSTTYSNTSGSTVANKPVQPPKGSKVIKTGSMQLEVKEINQAKSQVNYLVNKYQAYYANEKFDAQSYQNVYELQVRIPTESYEQFLQDLEGKKIGILKDKQIQSKDVGEEYFDMQTRLKNKLRYIERYATLLKQSKKISDIIEIQEKIHTLEEQIDRVKGRLRYLNDRISYGTLNIMIYQTIEGEEIVIEEDTFWDRFVDALANGWGAVQEFVLILFNIWPFFILIGFAIWFVRRKVFKKKAQ